MKSEINTEEIITYVESRKDALKFASSTNKAVYAAKSKRPKQKGKIIAPGRNHFLERIMRRLPVPKEIKDAYPKFSMSLLHDRHLDMRNLHQISGTRYSNSHLRFPAHKFNVTDFKYFAFDDDVKDDVASAAGLPQDFVVSKSVFLSLNQRKVRKQIWKSLLPDLENFRKKSQDPDIDEKILFGIAMDIISGGIEKNPNQTIWQIGAKEREARLFLKKINKEGYYDFVAMSGGEVKQFRISAKKVLEPNILRLAPEKGNTQEVPVVAEKQHIWESNRALACVRKDFVIEEIDENKKVKAGTKRDFNYMIFRDLQDHQRRTFNNSERKTMEDVISHVMTEASEKEDRIFFSCKVGANRSQLLASLAILHVIKNRLPYLLFNSAIEPVDAMKFANKIMEFVSTHAGFHQGTQLHNLTNFVKVAQQRIIDTLPKFAFRIEEHRPSPKIVNTRKRQRTLRDDEELSRG